MRKAGILLLSLALLLASGATVSGIASATDELVNTGANGYFTSASGSVIAFSTNEADVGQDLTGDGDANDSVIRYYDVSTNTLVNTGVAGHVPSVSGNIIAFQTHELWVGGEDLNGDGDANDTVIRYYNISAATVTNTGAIGSWPAVSGNIIAFSSSEWEIGEDLNGDADTWDSVIRYYDTAAGTLSNTGILGVSPAVAGNIIWLDTKEDWIGDANGDGDTFDTLISYYDIATGDLVNTEVTGALPAVSGNIVAFVSAEWTIPQDLNGDGDYQDDVIRYYEISTDVVTNTGAVGFRLAASGNIIAFDTFESKVGQDLNGDGDTSDAVIRYYEISTGALTNTGVVGEFPAVTDDIIAFTSSEFHLDQDLNGDGDASDYVVRYLNLLEVPTVPTIGAISEQIDAFVADGSIDNEGIAEALHAFLDQAQAMMEAGNIVAAENILNAFIKSVEAQSQSGRLITTDAAQPLIESAQAVVDSL